MKKSVLLATLAITPLLEGSAWAQPQRTPINVTIPVQGLLTDSSGVPLDATVSIRFRLYRTQVVATPFWEDTYTVRVGALFPGVFSVSLGSGSTVLTDETLQSNNTPWLGMRVGSDAEMPRWALERTPFAAYSNLAGDSSSGNGIPTGGIIWSEDDNDSNLTNAGFTRMGYTIEATCDPGVNCGGTGSSGGGTNIPQPQWGSVRIENRASLPTQLIWINGAGVLGAGCGSSKSFMVYSNRYNDGKRPHSYCVENDSWSTFPAAPSDNLNRYAFAAAALKHADGRYRFHVVGGNAPSRRHDVYDPQSGWTTNQAYPSSRYCLRGAVVKNKWYVFGGSSSSSNGSPVSTVYEFDPLTNNWSQKADLPSGPRAEHAVAATRGKIYVVAGRISGSLTSRTDVYDPETNSYSRSADVYRQGVSPAARGLGGRVVVHGGSGHNGSGTGCGPCYNDYRSYNPDSDSWTNHGDGGSRQGRGGGTAFQGAAVIGDCMHVAGGEPWQTRHDRICVPGAAAYDEAFDQPRVTLRAYRAP